MRLNENQGQTGELCSLSEPGMMSSRHLSVLEKVDIFIIVTNMAKSK